MTMGAIWRQPRRYPEAKRSAMQRNYERMGFGVVYTKVTLAAP
jgi:hypothetical protein